VIAHTAFDAALGRKPHEVIQEAKRMASQIQESSDLWDLEPYLTRRSKEINREYHSQLMRMLGDSMCEKQLRQGKLHRLCEGEAAADPFCRQIPAEDAA
jgi:hypothetical protein